VATDFVLVGVGVGVADDVTRAVDGVVGTTVRWAPTDSPPMQERAHWPWARRP
jgi:hypothetical protein